MRPPWHWQVRTVVRQFTLTAIGGTPVLGRRDARALGGGTRHYKALMSARAAHDRVAGARAS